MFGLFLVFAHAHGEDFEGGGSEVFGVDLVEELAHGAEIFEAFFWFGALDDGHQADEFKVFVVGGEVVFDCGGEIFGQESVLFGVAAYIDLEAEFDWFGGGDFEQWQEFEAIDGLDHFDEWKDFFDFVGLEWADEVTFVISKVAKIGFEVGPAVFGEVADCGMKGEHRLNLFR